VESEDWSEPSSLGHRIARLGIAMIGAAFLVFVLVLPGWSAANRTSLTPTGTPGMIALIVPVAPGAGSATLSLSAGTPGSSARTALSISASLNEEDELTNPITLLLAGEIRNSVGACSGKISVKRDILYENLEFNQGAALQGLKRDYSRTELTPDDSFTRDATILKYFEDVRYTVISFSTERNDQVTADGSGAKTTTPFRQVFAECALDMTSSWAQSGPQMRLSLPQIGVWTPDADSKASPPRFQVVPRVNLSISTGSALSLERHNLTPTEITPNSVKWSFSAESGTGWSYSSGDRYDTLRLANPVSVVFADAEGERRESATIYRSGVGLGIAGSLVAWMLPELYDLVLIYVLRRRKSNEIDISSGSARVLAQGTATTETHESRNAREPSDQES